jgi:hypothetical protein
MVEKVKDLIASDARFTTRCIAKCVGIFVEVYNSHTWFKNEKDKCQMYPISLQKAKSC